MKFLADTDCLVDFLKNRSPTNGAVRRGLSSGELAVCTISAYELYFGEASGERRRDIDALLDQANVVALSRTAAALAAAEGVRLQALGQRLDVPDLLIAGSALELGIPLVTRNVRHFSRIEGLALQDPN